MYIFTEHTINAWAHYLPPPVVVLCELHQLLVELVAVYGHVVLVEGVLEHEVGVEDVDLLEHLPDGEGVLLRSTLTPTRLTAYPPPTAHPHEGSAGGHPLLRTTYSRHAPATAPHLVEVLGLRVGSQEELETGGRVERLQHEGIGLE